MTPREAITLLERLQGAINIARECEYAMTHMRGGPDQLRIRCGSEEMFTRPADLLPLAKWAIEDITRELREGGYTVPDGGR